MIGHRVNQFEWWLRRNKKAIYLTLPFLLISAVQFLYPTDRLLPLTSVDGLEFSSWSKQDTVEALDSRYAQTALNLTFGNTDESQKTLLPEDIGIVVANDSKVSGFDYPWYLRILPGSVFFAQFLYSDSQPAYSYNSLKLDDYIQSEFDGSCNLSAKNASINVADGKLEVIGSALGGVCDINELKDKLSSLKIESLNSFDVHIDIEPTYPQITTEDAREIAAKVSDAIGDGVSLVASGRTFLVTADNLISWLEFTVEGDVLNYSFSEIRAGEYLNELVAAEIAVESIPNKIKTLNLIEVENIAGTKGQVLDIEKTMQNIKAYIDGGLSIASVGVKVIEPANEYERTYSPNHEGLSALMANFASSNAGTYGIALTELSGSYRWATYNGARKFTTASTYKLFVAYSTLLRIESGDLKWTDQIHGGRDLTKCFDDMIVISDNDCAHALVDIISNSAIHNEASAIGATNTSFLDAQSYKTSASDLALLLSKLYSGQILANQSTRDILINAMKRNVYRQGIPSGISETVADKVGFLWALLHDVAIVYSSSGTYVLVILTDGSSWGNIAELARQLEALRNQ